MINIKQIYESLILEAMSLEEIWEKYYKNDISNYTFFLNLNDIDPTSTSNKKGKYLDWIIKKAYKNNPKTLQEDAEKISKDLALFEQNYRHINKQINQIRDYHELGRLVQEFRKKKEAGEIDLSRKEIKAEAKKIFEDDTWLIIHPKTEASAKYYGAGTRWCTAADNNNMFDRYNKEGPLYILINKKDSKEKYQFHFQSEQYMDAEDDHIMITGYKKFPEIILDKLVELSSINKMAGNFIYNIFVHPIASKYFKDLSPESQSYIATIELLHVSTRSLDELKEVLKYKPNLSANGFSALLNAIQENSMENIKLLMDNVLVIKSNSIHGVSVTPFLFNYLIQHIMIEKNCLKLIKYLFDNKEKFNITWNTDKQKLDDLVEIYDHAIRTNFQTVAIYIIDNGLDINIYWGNPIREAINFDRWDVVNHLLSKKELDLKKAYIKNEKSKVIDYLKHLMKERNIDFDNK